MSGTSKFRQELRRIHGRVASALREVEKDSMQSIQDALASARASVEDVERDFAVPPRDPALRREEVEALRRHLRHMATLEAHVSNLDDPAWRAAYQAYERSWDELQRTLEGDAAPTSRRAPAAR